MVVEDKNMLTKAGVQEHTHESKRTRTSVRQNGRACECVRARKVAAPKQERARVSLPFAARRAPGRLASRAAPCAVASSAPCIAAARTRGRCG
eukprot:3287077-Pleurochrysis_carterae.AAC.1